MDIKKVIAVGKVVSTGQDVTCCVATVLFNVAENTYITGSPLIASYQGKSTHELADFILKQVDFSNSNVVIDGGGAGVSMCQHISCGGVIFDKFIGGLPCFKSMHRNRFVNIKSRCCFLLQSTIDMGGVFCASGDFELKKEFDANGKIKAWFVGRDAIATETVAMAFYDESLEAVYGY